MHRNQAPDGMRQDVVIDWPPSCEFVEVPNAIARVPECPMRSNKANERLGPSLSSLISGVSWRGMGVGGNPKRRWRRSAWAQMMQGFPGLGRGQGKVCWSGAKDAVDAGCRSGAREKSAMLLPHGKWDGYISKQ